MYLSAKLTKGAEPEKTFIDIKFVPSRQELETLAIYEAKGLIETLSGRDNAMLIVTPTNCDVLMYIFGQFLLNNSRNMSREHDDLPSGEVSGKTDNSV